MLRFTLYLPREPRTMPSPTSDEAKESDKTGKPGGAPEGRLKT